MGRKINVKVLVRFFVFILLPIVFYYPIISGSLPFNGNLLVEHWSPLNFLKWPEYPLGVPVKHMGIDEVLEFYPLLDFTYNSFKSGTIPLWNPYNFAGYSHIGNFASAVFYPIHVSMFILSKPLTLIFLKLSAIALSLFFMYRYLRVLELNEISSYFGALAFAFGATVQIWNAEIWQSVHAFLWFPLTLFFIEKLIREGKIKYGILLGFSIAMSIMAGYIQPTIYLLIFSFLYSFFRILTEKKTNIKTIISLLMGFLIGFAISAVQLFPSIEAYMLSPRSQVSLDNLNISFLLPPSHLVTLFVPDFFGNMVTLNWFAVLKGQYYENMIYVGIVPLVMASFAFWLKKYIKYVIFFAACALISLSLTFNSPTSKLIYDLSIPFLSSAIPIRIVFISSFAISVLSALGIEWWLTEKNKIKTFISIFPLILIFAGIGYFIFYAYSNNITFKSFPDNWYIISARNFIIPTAFAIGSFFILIVGQYFIKLKKILGIVLILASFISSFIFAHKYLSFTDKKFHYPSHPLIGFIKENQGYHRYWGYGSAGIPNNFATVYKINSPEGYDPVNISSYNELLSSSRGGGYEGAFSRSDALLYAVTEFPFKDLNDTQYRAMDILGVKYIGFEKEELLKIERHRLDPSRYEKVWEKDNFIVFENKKVFPRVFLADRFVLRTNREESLKTLYDKNIDLKSYVIVSENLPVKENKGFGTTRILSHDPNRVIIETETDESKILVLSDAYYPGWKATVQPNVGSKEKAVETKIYRVDHAFRGVIVPPGKNKVVFSYQPLSFSVGMLITIISSLSIVVFYFKKIKHVN